MGLAPPGVKVPELRLDREGAWYVDGERILHARTCAVLTKNVYLLDDGRLATSIGRETVPIVVDDVGFFVRAADLHGDDLRVLLSDDTYEAVTELRAGSDDCLYARVKAGRAWARFSRAAQHRLEPYVVEEDGRLGMRFGNRFVQVSLRR